MILTAKHECAADNRSTANSHVVLDSMAFRPRSPLDSRWVRAFTLLEVMIALAIFFMAIFSILELTSRNLKAAHALRHSPPDIGSLAAELSLTNILIEGVESGGFGDLYPGYHWTREIIMAGSNGLFQANFVVTWTEDHRPKQSTLSTLFYRPQSPPGGRRR